MYGYTPRAATLRFASAPPLNKSRKPSSACDSNACDSACGINAWHRHMRYEAEHDQHRQREQDLSAQVWHPHGIDHRLD